MIGRGGDRKEEDWITERERERERDRECYIEIKRKNIKIGRDKKE